MIVVAVAVVAVAAIAAVAAAIAVVVVGNYCFCCCYCCIDLYFSFYLQLRCNMRGIAETSGAWSDLLRLGLVDLSHCGWASATP